jgi:competence protein ComGC
MSGEVAAVIAATGTLLTALAVLLTAVSVLVPILRKRIDQVQATAQTAVDKVAEVQATAQAAVDKVSDVHVMVNQQRTDMLRYQAALTDALHVAGIPIPADQSLTAAAPKPND